MVITEELLSHCDSLLKAGKTSSVVTLLAKVNLAQVERPLRQPLAKICRRTGLIEKGLRLLQPLIREQRERAIAATPGEACEYAVLLSRNGSIAEALDLLGAVKPEEASERLLYEGFCHVSMWSYQRALVCFENFLRLPGDPYTKMVAQVNCAASYLAVERHEEAVALLDHTIPLALKSGSHRLLGNALELRGHARLLRGDTALALQDFGKAMEIFSQNQIYDRLLVKKWYALIEATGQNSVAPLMRFRDEAITHRHWESVREADLWALKIKNDQPTFDHLYFGTPMPPYRERILKQLQASPSSSYLWGDRSGRILDLKTGDLTGTQGEMNPGKKIHQLVSVLSSDFYMPFNLGNLFSALYPTEFFNADTSPTRTRQALRRTRRWLRENKIPLLIQHHNGFYKLKFNGPFGILIPLERDPVTVESALWERLKTKFPAGKRFTAEQACEASGLSRSGFHRLAAWALKSGELTKSGRGRACHYEVKNDALQILKSA